MTKSFLPHFSAIALFHVLIFMGTWQLGQSEYLRQKLYSLGPSVLKLQVASRIVSAAPKKISPRTTEQPKVTPSVRPPEKTSIAKQTPSTNGSEFGTSLQGKSDVLTVYKAELRAVIDKNKYYPSISRRLGQSGTVVVAFTLLEDGHIIDVRIDSPSRYDRLNESALDAVKKVERFKPIPKEVGEAKMDIKIPVKFVTI